MSSQRSSSRPGTKKFEFRKTDKKKDAEENSYSSSDDEDDEFEDEDEEVNYGARTLGRACMYGGNGEVIFRPEGSICRGDERAPSRAKKRRKKNVKNHARKPVEQHVLPAPEPLSAGVPAAAAAVPADVVVEAPPAASAPAERPVARRATVRKVRKSWPGEGKPRGCIFGKDGSVLRAPKGVDCS